jgi:hypothetical protein
MQAKITLQSVKALKPGDACGVYAADLDMPIHGVTRLGDTNLFQVNTQPLRDWGYASKLALDYLVGSVSSGTPTGTA